MIVKKLDKNVTLRQFNSITELVEFNHGKIKDCFKEQFKSSYGKHSFTQTKSYEEAEELLLHGWEEMAKKLNTKLQRMNVSKQTKQKTVYDVCGYQCSVPRYLQGIPTNMINQKVVTKKQKVITITKNISYSAHVRKETIEEESIKVLQLVNSLEKQGYRVILNVTLISKSKKENIIICNKVRIKNANERLNLSKISFPMVHSSYLRRIIFRWIETFEYTTKSFDNTYGSPVKCEDFNNIIKNNKNDNEYFAEALYSLKDTLTLDDLIK